ncbi:MAG: alpha-glucan family phosphorylase [Burkholderiales bacterium]|nr:alpha-glucan family phosphorylase [Burkholderiales bacterium]
MHNEFIHQQRIAYFTMEIALKSDIPTYSGGLGVLAGDVIRAGADIQLPLVAVSLVSRAGYFRQQISNGRQIEHPDIWDPARWAVPLDAKIAVNIEGREVWVRGWLYVLKGHLGGQEPVILLDTDLDENREDDRQITHYLYGGDTVYRLKQEIVLGIGGLRMLHALGFQIRQYHMNEGHSALLALELLRRYARFEDEEGIELSYDIPMVRELCNFTTHTPVEAGHDKFPYPLVESQLRDYMDFSEIRQLAGEDYLNMTRLALNLSEYVNGVAMSHARISQKMYPGYHVHAITNGVHPHTWTCRSFAALYDRYLPGWCHEPQLLVRVDQIPDELIWGAHAEAKAALLEKVEALSGIRFDPDIPVFGFARRMTEYKRPDLLFSDLERIRRIAKNQPFQLVMAGKAHPKDENGRRLIALLHEHLASVSDCVKSAFLSNYDMDLALSMVSGVDVWLNTPLRPLEASGTSGMKAAFNGIPSLSVLDGWWLEGCIEGVTGWAVGDDSDRSNGTDAGFLYEKLEKTVLPLYHDDRKAWITIMKNAIGKNASYFNSHRMMRRYATEAYIR